MGSYIPDQQINCNQIPDTLINNDNWVEEAMKMGYTDVIDRIRQEVEMQHRKTILDNHKFSITEMTEHRKSGDITRYRTYLPNENGKRGKAIAKNTRKELEDFLVDFYRKQDKDSIPTFGDVYDKWVVYHHKLNNSGLNTIDKYKTDYSRFIKDTPIESMPITDIRDTDIEEYFLDAIASYQCRTGEMGLEYKPFGKLYGYIEGVFKYAYKHRMIDKNPMWYLEKKDFRNACKPKKEKTAETELIPDDVFNLLLEQLYRDIEKNPKNFTYYAVEFAAKTAMRVGEVATLKWSDINYNEGYIEISRSDKYNKVRNEKGEIISRFWTVEETKTKKKRRFPIDEYIITSLNRIRKAQMTNGLASEWIFPHPEYGWTHSHMISSCIKNKCKQIGLDRTYGIHAFRKTLNSDMRNDNASAKICSSMIGNSPEVNDTHYYYDNSDMDLKRDYVSKAHSKRAYI